MHYWNVHWDAAYADEPCTRVRPTHEWDSVCLEVHVLGLLRYCASCCVSKYYPMTSSILSCILQEKMALSLTFAPPAPQSGAIASSPKWRPYAQLATRRRKWFIRAAPLSSHLLPSSVVCFQYDRLFHSRQRSVWPFWAVGSTTDSWAASCEALRAFHHEEHRGSVCSSPLLRHHSSRNDSTRQVWWPRSALQPGLRLGWRRTCPRLM